MKIAIGNKIKEIFSGVENNFKGGLLLWAVSFLSIITVRLSGEVLILGIPKQNTEEFVAFFVHTLLFFLMTYLVFLVYLRVFTKKEWLKLTSVLLWGFWLIIFPPIIDKIVFGGRKTWSFYVFDGIDGLIEKFFTFFGDNLMMGITLGTRVMIFAVLVLLAFYYFYNKRSWIKTIFFLVGAYIIFFILASLPSFIVLIREFFVGGNIFEVNYGDVAKIFLTPVDYFSYQNQHFNSFMAHKLALFYIPIIIIQLLAVTWMLNKDKFLALIKNIRFPQVFFNFGLFFIGLGLAVFYFPENFDPGLFPALAVLNLLISIFFIWLFSVVVNDIYDIGIDKITNQERPLVKGVLEVWEYIQFGVMFLFIALIGSLIVGVKFFLLICVYALITWIYSSPPFRFKKFFPVASIFSAFASIIFLLMGYVLVSKNQELVNFPWKVFWLLVFAYVAVIPIKDFKDIKGDRKQGIKTLPVLLGENNTRLLMAVLVFLCYFLSVYVINEPGLFWPAVVFGGVSFWKIAGGKKLSGLINWWLLGLVFCYGLFVVYYIFF